LFLDVEPRYFQYGIGTTGVFNVPLDADGLALAGKEVEVVV
jgi:hypothetical protein